MNFIDKLIKLKSYDPKTYESFGALCFYLGISVGLCLAVIIINAIKLLNL